ncbi:tRNA lysidine(34) synthetase TilS, partial [Oleiphilus sp. HI0066]|uniref:tRNA lysidine(34) synthetase TilS n=3 Tax=Oleiphilus TaxID=141450 RepID=UPI000838D305
MIEAKLQQALASFPDAKTIYIAYSSGLDSTALLLSAVRSLQTLKPTQSFCAIHVHHGLSSHADAWAEHCQAVCAEYQIPCIVERVQLDLKGKSLEQAAREARYAVFKRHVGTDDILLLAHHLDDQIETVLMRLIRETDSSLLAAIPHSRPMGLGHLVRPFLDLRRKDLE